MALPANIKALPAPRIQVVSATDVATLQAQVDAVVNGLNKRLVNPEGASFASGAVLNGSTTVHPATTMINAAQLVTYNCSITWTEFLLPS